jgi:uncharacterized damage-inducible protein DinB
MESKEKKIIWINSGILSQFSSTWKMLRSAIEVAPDEYWYGKTHDWSFSRTLYHIIETQRFYIRDTPDGMEWEKLLKELNTEDKPLDEVYPPRVILSDFLEKTEVEVTSYIKGLTLDKLLEKDDFKWFSSVFEKLLYLMRHNQHHIGELSRMLREWDCERVKWT